MYFLKELLENISFVLILIIAVVFMVFLIFVSALKFGIAGLLVSTAILIGACVTCLDYFL